MIKFNCAAGISKDVMAEELAEQWSDGRNMRFHRGFAVRCGGIADQFAPPFTPYWTHFYETAALRYWVAAGLAKVYTYTTAGVANEITPASDFTGGIEDRWTGGVGGGILGMNNGVEQPHYYAGSGDLAVFPGWNANWRAKAVRPFKQFWVAINVTKSGTNYRHMVKWSDAAAPGAMPTSWDEADETLLAGEVELAETSDACIDSMPWGDSNIVFKERSMYRMTFIGGEQIFQFQRIPGDYGMMSRGCGVSTPVGLAFWSMGDLCLFDGQGVRSIAEGSVRQWVFDNLDPDNFKRAFACANPMAEEVLFCFPSRGSGVCDIAAVWCWSTGLWSIRTLANVTFGAVGLLEDTGNSGLTWSDDTQTWEQQDDQWLIQTLNLTETRLMLSRVNALAAYDFGGTDAGVAIDSYLERTGIAYDDSVKLLRRVYLTIDAAAGETFSIYVGASMYSDTAPTWESPVTFTQGASNKVDVLCKGRSFALRIVHNGSNPWRTRQLTMDVKPSGRF